MTPEVETAVVAFAERTTSPEALLGFLSGDNVHPVVVWAAHHCASPSSEVLRQAWERLPGDWDVGDLCTGVATMVKAEGISDSATWRALYRLSWNSNWDADLLAVLALSPVAPREIVEVLAEHREPIVRAAATVALL